MAGFSTIAQVDQAFPWAVQNRYVRESDAYLNTTSSNLKTQLARQFGTTVRAGTSVKQGKGHWYVVNSSNKEVYNSAGLGKKV